MVESPAPPEPTPPVAEPPRREEPQVVESPAPPEPTPPVDAALAPLPDTEAWLQVARRGLDEAPAKLDDELESSLDLGGDPGIAELLPPTPASS